jgi:hypothetical protein
MNAKIEKLKALIDHPNTPRHEREAAIRIYNKLNLAKRQVKVYQWVQFTSKVNGQ